MDIISSKPLKPKVFMLCYVVQCCVNANYEIFQSGYKFMVYYDMLHVMLCYEVLHV